MFMYTEDGRLVLALLLGAPLLLDALLVVLLGTFILLLVVAVGLVELAVVAAKNAREEIVSCTVLASHQGYGVSLRVVDVAIGGGPVDGLVCCLRVCEGSPALERAL